MVHLAVSVQLFERSGVEPNADFLLGSLAPDSIHMRSGASKEAKSKTHLNLLPLNNIPIGFDKLSHCKSFLQQYETGNQSCRAFILGYISHILTDIYWLNTLHRLFRERVPEGISPQEKKRMYTLERSQLDYNLYNHAEWSPSICRIVTGAQGFDLSDQLLTEQEIRGWRDQVLRAFVEQDEPDIANRYITVAELEWFIQDAADHLLTDFNLMGIDLWRRSQ
jgi:hypothetical protein